MTAKTVVLLIDSQHDSMEHLASRLNEDAQFEVIALPGDDRTLFGLIGLHRPDIVVYDFLSGERGGITLMESITELFGESVKKITNS
jgi:DNA-binding NarL/FixJ family response regulator